MYREAFKQAAKAYYKHSHLDDRMQELEKRYVPEEVKKHGGTIVGVVTLIMERRVQFRWTFK